MTLTRGTVALFKRETNHRLLVTRTSLPVLAGSMALLHAMGGDLTAGGPPSMDASETFVDVVQS